MVFGFVFELIFELVAEVVGELLVQLLGDALFRPLWRRYGSERRRRVLVGMLVGVVAFAYGFGWGAYRVEDGATALPPSMWVTLALAAAFALAAWFQPRLPAWGPTRTGRIDIRTGQLAPDADGAGHQHEQAARLADTVLPWRWSRERLAHFAAANVAIAAGIATGYVVLV